jgi:hypothetical protein
MGLVEDITALLITGGFGTVYGTDIFYRLPALPLNCVSIFLIGGPEPDYYSTNAAPGALDYAGFQIQVRNTNSKTARDNAEAIRKAFDLATLSGYVILRTTRAQPIDLTNDDDLKAKVYRFSVDFTTVKVRV